MHIIRYILLHIIYKFLLFLNELLSFPFASEIGEEVRSIRVVLRPPRPRLHCLLTKGPDGVEIPIKLFFVPFNFKLRKGT
jgi:hypothetical protein